VNDFIAPVAVWCAAIIEAIGIGTITLFALYALFNAATRMLKKEENDSIFQELRQSLGRGILLGLEFLIASDIIYTVAVELTFQKIGVLAIVVLIRTFLSLTLEVEMSGKWPWQDKP
jgi:Predicted membrane protein